MSALPVPVPAPHTKPGLSLFEDQYWYTGGISERKAEEVLKRIGQEGSFLVRDCLLPDADYVLSVNSGNGICHFKVEVDESNECQFNEYLFTSLPEAITFYTENRLRNVFLLLPEEPIVRDEDTPKVAGPVIKPVPHSMAHKPQLAQQQQTQEETQEMQEEMQERQKQRQEETQKERQDERQEQEEAQEEMQDGLEHIYCTIPSMPPKPSPPTNPPPSSKKLRSLPPPSPQLLQLPHHMQAQKANTHLLPPSSRPLPAPTSPPPPPPTSSSSSSQPPPPPPPPILTSSSSSQPLPPPPPPPRTLTSSSSSHPLSPPLPPPRSPGTVLTTTAWKECPDSGLPSSGEDASGESGSPQQQDIHNFVLKAKDRDASELPSSTAKMDAIESVYVEVTDIVDNEPGDDPEGCDQAHLAAITDPENICETTFDDVMSSDTDDLVVKYRERKTSDASTADDRDRDGLQEEDNPSVTARASVTPERESVIPDVLMDTGKREQLFLLNRKVFERQTVVKEEDNEVESTPIRPPAPPGKVVISNALQGITPGPLTGQHPLLLQKQREREEREREEREEREREERERKEREAREREERQREEKERERKKKNRFSFIGRKKEKAEKGMKRGESVETKEEVDLATFSPPTSPDRSEAAAVLPMMSPEQQVELQSKFANITHNKWREAQAPSHSGFALPPSTDTKPLKMDHPTQVAPVSIPVQVQQNGARSSTLERIAPKPPSSVPPSLPDTHHSSMERRSGSRPGTMERIRTSSRPGSGQGTLDRVHGPGSRQGTLDRVHGPGSRQGTLDRVHAPPPPTSHPPPVPLEAMNRQNGSKQRPMGSSKSTCYVSGGYQMNLLEAIQGVDPSLLTSTPRSGPEKLMFPSLSPGVLYQRLPQHDTPPTSARRGTFGRRNEAKDHMYRRHRSSVVLEGHVVSANSAHPSQMEGPPMSTKREIRKKKKSIKIRT